MQTNRALLGMVLLLAGRLATASAAETNFNIDVGGTSIAIPAPGKEYVELGSERRGIFPPGAPNDLLAWFAPSNDVAKSALGKGLRQHMQVQVLKQGAKRTISASEFKDVVDNVAKQQDADYSAAADDVNKLLKQTAQGTNDLSSIQVGAPKPLGSFLKEENAVGVMMLMSVSYEAPNGGRENVPLFCATCLVRVKDKLIYAYVYKEANGDKALEWVKSTAKTWVDSILKANQPAAGG